jgi:hypothetical protein
MSKNLTVPPKNQRCLMPGFVLLPAIPQLKSHLQKRGEQVDP